MTMQIKPGFYITRDGRLAEVRIVSGHTFCEGFVGGRLKVWDLTGEQHCSPLTGDELDLIRPATQEEIERIK